MVGAQQIDAGDVQAHDACSADCGGAFLGRDLDQAGSAAAMQVGAEFAGLGLALDCRDHLVTDDEAANVGAAGLLDVLLNHDRNVQTHEGLEHAFGSLAGLAQYDTDPLGAF